MNKSRRMLGVGTVGLFVLASACSSETEAPPVPTSANNEVIETDPVTGTTDFFMPDETKPALAPGQDPNEAALAFLDANKDKLGIPNPRGSYVPVPNGVTKDDDDQTTHVKLQLVAEGIAVWGIMTTVHFDEAGFVDLVDGPFIPGLDAIAKQVPAVSAETAKTAADPEVRDLAPTSQGVTWLTSELVVYVDDDFGSPRLARHLRGKVVMEDRGGMLEVFVDAMTGEILDSWDESADALEQREARAVGYGGKTYTTPVSFDGSNYRHERLASENRSQITTGRWVGKEGKEDWQYFDHSSVEGPWDKQAVTAVFHVQRSEEFYREDLKYSGPSGKNSAVWVNVHLKNDGDWNAYATWSDDGNTDLLSFTGPEDGMKAPVIALDVVGHEFTHLVTAYNSKLVYRRQPGAINEAMSDIFGAFIERKVEGRSNRSFLMAEDAGSAIRDMRHPREACETCPDNYENVRVLKKGDKPRKKNDQGYVHSNSSIVNNAWALIVEGGANDTSQQAVADGIGWDKSIKLWWKTQRSVLTPRSSILRLGRAQTALAAKSKGRFDKKIVACSWAAVGTVKKPLLEKIRVSCGVPASTNPPSAGNVETPCTGRADGAYCSPADPFLGILCRGGKVETDLKCPPPFTKCTGPAPDNASILCN